MKNILKLENLLLSFLFLYMLNQLLDNTLILALLFFTPDLGMIGYLANNKIGSYTYNLTHHLGIGAIFALLYLETDEKLFGIVGFIILAHSTFDRFLGYGLKKDTFQNTHLGRIGRKVS
ncbi:MAG: DUF4260 family protein [Candidatus Dojkabacteria bacterium]|nr:DUF4260 family protein [Candidatus Dojkabacteria bacterium]MDQ7021527.1 DUF4260 family protein [Candidatus Dojkabacteria bacterium]